MDRARSITSRDEPVPRGPAHPHTGEDIIHPHEGIIIRRDDVGCILSTHTPMRPILRPIGASSMAAPLGATQRPR